MRRFRATTGALIVALAPAVFAAGCRDFRDYRPCERYELRPDGSGGYPPVDFGKPVNMAWPEVLMQDPRVREMVMKELAP